MRIKTIFGAIIYLVFLSSFVVTQNSQFESHAVYKDGEAAMYRLIATTIKYPESARREGSEGLVLVSFTVNKDGEVVDVSSKLKEGYLLKEVVVVGNSLSKKKYAKANDDLKEEVASAVNRLGKFIPAQKDGKAVSSVLILPVQFKLNR